MIEIVMGIIVAGLGLLAIILMSLFIVIIVKDIKRGFWD